MTKREKRIMKKGFSILLLVIIMGMALVLGLFLPAVAGAEAVETDPSHAVLVDLTDVLIAVVLAVGSFVWRKWVRPWLERKELMEEASIVVNAVEALMGRGHGTEKWQMAVDKMHAYGFNIDADAVLDALRVAWRNMNTEQLRTGEKEKPPEQ